MTLCRLLSCKSKNPFSACPWSALPEKDPEVLLEREWLVTNGLGGYASGTVSGACTRRYHGLLIAALPAPLGRFVMFNHITEEIKLEDRKIIRLDLEDSASSKMDELNALGEFRLDGGLPFWRYEIGPIKLEKHLLMPYLQNTVYIHYRLLAAPGTVRLRLRPSMHFRPHEAPVTAHAPFTYTVTAVEDRIDIRSDAEPLLRIRAVGGKTQLILDGGRFHQVHYRAEKARGYEYEGNLWSPGYYRTDLTEGQEIALIGSTEAWDTIIAVEPREALEAEMRRREKLVAQSCPEAQADRGSELVLAGDQFIIRPSTRLADLAVAHATGDDVRSMIAGYHWFTEWGRDTMISMEGLMLLTGRQAEAGYLLRTFARYVRDGLIPNLFPEGEKEGLYHTADATLWYFHALERYWRATGDWETLRSLLPMLRDIIDHHYHGTRFGIHVDPNDGLLSQGQEGYQLTWMDAKIGDWVVTPRRGKAVEINALFYNALRLLEFWSHQAGDDNAATLLAARAAQTCTSFNKRFWHAEGEYLYDVVDGEKGDDAALRPNQVFAISLDYPVLDQTYWKPVIEQVTKHLLTPVGLRSLAPAHSDYKPTYDGDLRCAMPHIIRAQFGLGSSGRTLMPGYGFILMKRGTPENC